MKPLYLAILLCFGTQIFLLGQSGFLPGVATSAPGVSSGRGACCGAWYEAKGPGGHAVADLIYADGHYFILTNVDGRGAITKYSDGGTQVWRYRMEQRSEFEEMERLESGQFVIVGSVWKADGGQAGLVLTLSEMGEVLQNEIIDSNDTEDIVVEQLALAEVELASRPYSFVASTAYIGYEAFYSPFREGVSDREQSYNLIDAAHQCSQYGDLFSSVKYYDILRTSAWEGDLLLSGHVCDANGPGILLSLDDDGSIVGSRFTAREDAMHHLASLGTTGLLVATGEYRVTTGSESNYSTNRPAIHLIYPQVENEYRSYTFDQSRLSKKFHSLAVTVVNGETWLYAASDDVLGRPAIVQAQVETMANGEKKLDFSTPGLTIGPAGEVTNNVQIDVAADGQHLYYAYGFARTSEGAQWDLRFGEISLPFSPSTCLPEFSVNVNDEGIRDLVAAQQANASSSLNWSVSSSPIQLLNPEDFLVNGPCPIDDLTPCVSLYPITTSGYFKLPRTVPGCNNRVSEVRITNALGRTINGGTFKVKEKDIVVDIQSLPPGNYYLSLSASDRSLVYRISVSTL